MIYLVTGGAVIRSGPDADCTDQCILAALDNMESVYYAGGSFYG